MDRSGNDVSLYLLFGRTRAAVLRVLHAAADDGVPLHLREIARRGGLSPSAVQYELRLLSQLDLLNNIGTVARPLYVLNAEHRLYAALHSMFAGSAEDRLLGDDSHFARKRTQQRRDHRANSRDNSAFLRQWGTLADKVKVS
jgi:hypothetical protein